MKKSFRIQVKPSQEGKSGFKKQTADRELDRLVAENVIGLKTRFEKGEPVAWDGKAKKPLRFYPNDYIVLDKKGQPQTVICIPGGEGYYLVPRYSSEITAAWDVWERLRQSGKWCCLDITSDYDYCWRVSLTPSEVDPEQKKRANTKLHRPIVVVDGEESAPRAICLAALKAVGWKK